MGFSDTATYVKSESTHRIEGALASLLKSLGFEPDAGGSPGEPIASYDEPQTQSRLAIWAKNAAPSWWRLYSNAPGLFTWHNGDNTPFLQRLAKRLNTTAFEICIDDGDSICVLETNGEVYRLTGAHSYVLDCLYEQDETMSFVPGTVFPLKGVQLAYESLEVDARIVEGLIGYEFGHDMQQAISGFETTRFGRPQDSYYDANISEADADWQYSREGQ